VTTPAHADSAYAATVTARLDVPSEGLSGAALAMWAATLPASAQVTAVMGERGSQRDPEPFLRALVAKWAPSAVSDWLHSMTAPSSLRFGFRRRCAWCGVVLRGWQLNCCRRCKRAVDYSPSPWCGSGSRWDAEPDARRSHANRDSSVRFVDDEGYWLAEDPSRPGCRHIGSSREAALAGLADAREHYDAVSQSGESGEPRG
jgi:predicted RNase H-like HicB family nuclease